MTHNNLLPGYSWDTQYEDTQQQFSRHQDEVISVYEIYVKEETVGPDGRSEVAVISGDSGSSNQLIQGDCMGLDAAIDSEVINVDGTVTKLLSKDSMDYKILEQNVDEKIVMYSHPANEIPMTTTTRLIDKDDPRSRLHFVKYLKRDGKTLKIWECGICSKEFRHQYTLMRHLPTHTDERNFKCETCGKAFRQLSTLSQHRAIHSDARPYVCEFCKKTFNRVSTLISHRKTHSEVKPHKCHMCGKGFHQKGNLRNHVFTHTNERPYKCELCGKGFNQMSNLMCHKVKAHAHTEKSQYVCGICGKDFPRRFSLRSHEEYKHGIKYCQPNSTTVLDVGNHNVARKNVRIVHLPNGDRTLLTDARDKEPLTSAGYSGSVIIDKIETKAMETAVLQGQTPFALFKPAKGIPVLVKVSSTPSDSRKQLLTPATAEDLRMAGKMTLSPTLTADADGIKAVQIKVPVVATVTERIDADRNLSFLIEPPETPGPDQEQDGLIESQFSCPEARESWAESVRQHQQTQSSTDGSRDCDLLTLAAQGGIQFVRATEDGRYEVMSNSEARDLMAQNCHDVTILNDDEAISVVNLDNNIRSMPVDDEIILGDNNNRITVLNAGNSQKNISMEGIEVLGSKDIQILGGRGLDERFVDGITILDQSKIDDMILCPKALNVDGSITILGQDNSATGQQNLSVLNSTLAKCHRNNAMTLTDIAQQPMTSLLTKNQPGISTLSQSLQSFDRGQSLSQSMTMLDSNDISQQSITSLLTKHQPSVSSLSQSLHSFDQRPSLNENITILGSNGVIKPQDLSFLGQQTDYTSRTKVAKFDVVGTESNPMPMNQQEVKILGARKDNVRILG